MYRVSPPLIYNDEVTLLLSEKDKSNNLEFTAVRR